MILWTMSHEENTQLWAMKQYSTTWKIILQYNIGFYILDVLMKKRIQPI